jgi:hypothetical protein
VVVVVAGAAVVVAADAAVVVAAGAAVVVAAGAGAVAVVVADAAVVATVVVLEATVVVAADVALVAGPVVAARPSACALVTLQKPNSATSRIAAAPSLQRPAVRRGVVRSRLPNPADTTRSNTVFLPRPLLYSRLFPMEQSLNDQEKYD